LGKKIADSLGSDIYRNRRWREKGNHPEEKGGKEREKEKRKKREPKKKRGEGDLLKSEEL